MGCSAIPTDVTLSIGSTPNGILVASSQGWDCTTPCEMTVERGSELELEFTAEGFNSSSVSVAPPIIKQKRRTTYIAAGVGAVVGYEASRVAHELSEAIVGALFLGLFNVDLEPEVASTSDHLYGVVSFAAAFGAIGYLIDRRNAVQQAKKPEVIQVELNPL